MTNDTAACPVCRGTDIEVVKKTVTEKVRGGGSVSFVEEFSRCRTCGEEFYSIEQSLASSRAHAAAVREAKGLLSPDQIRDARRNLGMTQEEFESALAVGKKTVVRWERGTVAPSMAANGLLWVALHYPDVFRQYATREAEVVTGAGETRKAAEANGVVWHASGVVSKHIGTFTASTSAPRGPIRYEKFRKLKPVLSKKFAVK